MARKISTEEHKKILAQKKELAEYIMKKIGMSYAELIEEAEGMLIHQYSGLLTKAEKQKFNFITFAD